jgi:hypothetical protein
VAVRALVVFEPWAQIGRPTAVAIAEGLADAGGQSTAVEVRRAADAVPESVDLLVVGAPADARVAVPAERVARAASDPYDAPRTVRQWLSYVCAARPGAAAVAYDIRAAEPGTGVVRLVRTATATEKALRRAGFRTVAPAEHFVCGGDLPDALVQAELARARAWGRRLARVSAEHPGSGSGHN